MRYASSENTILAGKFESGQTVKIKIIDMNTDSLVKVSSDKCVESVNSPGTYFWNTSNIITTFENDTHLFYEMYDQTGKTFYGKFVYSGVVDNIIETKNIVTEVKSITNKLLNIEEGTWEIKDNQMIIYSPDGVELDRFNLYDKNGNPTEQNVFKRERA